MQGKVEFFPSEKGSSAMVVHKYDFFFFFFRANASVCFFGLGIGLLNYSQEPGQAWHALSLNNLHLLHSW